VRVGRKAGWSDVVFCWRERVDELRDDRRLMLRGSQRRKMRDRAERAAGVGVLRARVHVQELSGADEDDQRDAEERKQNPEGLAASGAALSR
jgi:hypothetical protein